VIWALDRAGRDRVRLAHDIAEFARKGVAVVSVRESWLDQPVGPLRDLLIQIMGWFAESERARLVERTKAGLARARAQGKTLGRPAVAAAMVEKVRACWANRERPALVARLLKLPDSTVRMLYKRCDRESQERVGE
jgi:DNA invertase Pin-like site-specific DNA recombinase